MTTHHAMQSMFLWVCFCALDRLYSINYAFICLTILKCTIDAPKWDNYRFCFSCFFRAAAAALAAQTGGGRSSRKMVPPLLRSKTLPAIITPASVVCKVAKKGLLIGKLVIFIRYTYIYISIAVSLSLSVSISLHPFQYSNRWFLVNGFHHERMHFTYSYQFSVESTARIYILCAALNTTIDAKSSVSEAIKLQYSQLNFCLS